MDIPAVIEHYNDDSGSSAMLGTQILEAFNHEAFDFDEGDLRPPDLHTTDASIYGLNESQLVINSLLVGSLLTLAGRLDGENTHFQNDSVLAGPILCSTPSTRSSSPVLSYVSSKTPDAATQFSLLGNILPIPHTTQDPNCYDFKQFRQSSTVVGSKVQFQMSLEECKSWTCIVLLGLRAKFE